MRRLSTGKHDRESEGAVRMRSWKLAACLVILPVAAVNLYLFAPRVAISQVELNFGKVIRGTREHADISLRNTGWRTLRILDVETMCECTRAEVNKRTLKPGDSARVHVDLDTSTLSGQVSRLVSIRTDASIEGTIFMPVSCTVTGGKKQ